MKVMNPPTDDTLPGEPPGKPGRSPSARSAPTGDEAGAALDRRLLLQALQAAADGDFSVRLPGHWTGLEGKIADRFNHIVASNQ